MIRFFVGGDDVYDLSNIFTNIFHQTNRVGATTCSMNSSIIYMASEPSMKDQALSVEKPRPRTATVTCKEKGVLWKMHADQFRDPQLS